MMTLKVRLGSEEEHRLWDARDKELVPVLEQEVRNSTLVYLSLCHPIMSEIQL